MNATRRTIIETIDLRKTYLTGSVPTPVLHGVNLKIYEGDFVALMGKSGSGKSTLMNLLGCLDRPTSGQYLFEGRDISNFSRNELATLRNDKLGFVFQGFNLLPRTSALENVMLPLQYSKRFKNPKVQHERASQLLEMVGLKERSHHHPNQLSGGQQQRVAIARSLVNQPMVLLADEPTGNLDERTGLEILAEFQRLNSEGQTIIMVTHDLEIADCCKRQVWLRDGKIVKDVPTEHWRDAAVELKEFLAKQTSELAMSGN